MIRNIGKGLFAGLVVICLSSCHSQQDDSEGLTVFRYNEASNISSLDPVYARNQANIWASSQLFSSLLRLNDDLNPEPAVAKNWEVSEDGRIYTFFLRDDVFFHDDPCFPGGSGRRVVAEDFVFSLGRLVDPSLNAPGIWVLNQVERTEKGLLNIHAPNDTTLIIRLQQPFPAFPALLTMQYCSVVPHEALAAYGQDFRKNPVGTGPFRFAYWKEGVKLVFRKNENYFEYEGMQQLPYLDAVSISFIIDRQTAFLEFIKGNLEFLSGVDASYKDELLTPDGKLQPPYEDRFQMLSMPFLNTEYLGILVNEEKLPADWPLKSRKVRQAINYGFDREKMLKFLRNNVGTPAYAGFVPLGMPGFSSNTGGYSYQPDKARSLLAEAGFPNGDGLPPITLLTNQDYLDISQYIQHELSRIGIRVLIDVMPPATLREMMAKGEAAFFRASWIADYPDAENYFALFHGPNKSPVGPNYTHFQHKEYDEKYEKSFSIVDDESRHKLYHEMNQILIEQAPVVFLFYDRSVRFVHVRVKNMSNSPLNHLDLRKVRVENNPL